ncbi:MAG: 6-bladed beta-propeller [Mediterranea sp.]|jgi:hypothetical protein|nr:6-bladed beta-propeller [Mediterranea sp.]
MKRNKLYVIAIACGITACSSASQNGDGSLTYIVNGNDTLTVATLSRSTPTRTVLLSELVKRCELIRFDNVEEALFKPWWITTTPGHIGIRPSGNPFKLFSREGKFLTDVGAVGQGPGEYAITLYDEFIDEQHERIYAISMMSDKILVYNFQGTFQREIKLPHRLQKGRIKLSDDGSTITLAHMPFEGDPYFAIHIDTLGNVLNGVAPRTDFIVPDFNGELSTLKNTDAFDIYHTSVDTLFHLTPDNLSLRPVFTTQSTDMPADSWAHIYREIPTAYLVSAWQFKEGDDRRNYFIDKRAHTTSQFTLVNDFFGGLEMPTAAFMKGYFCYCLEPLQLIDLIDKRLEQDTCTDADKEKLQTMKASLHENDNNVMFLGKLKDF